VIVIRGVRIRGTGGEARLFGFCEWRNAIAILRIDCGSRNRLRSVMGFPFTNIAFDALNCRRCYHCNNLHPCFDDDPIGILDPVTIGIRILDSVGRSGHPGIIEIDLDHNCESEWRKISSIKEHYRNKWQDTMGC